MYDIIKQAIANGGYKLADITRKIKRLYILGDLTEAQMDELLTLAAQGISTDAERPETIKMILTLSDRVDALTERVAALEGGATETPDTGETTPETEAWQPWDGIGNKYQLGSVVTHNGKTWESTYNGQNVWEPGAPGTEALWKEVTDE